MKKIFCFFILLGVNFSFLAFSKELDAKYDSYIDKCSFESCDKNKGSSGSSLDDNVWKTITFKELSFFTERNSFENVDFTHVGIKMNVGWDYFSFYYLFSVGSTDDGAFHRHIPLGVYVLYKLLGSLPDTENSGDDRENKALEFLIAVTLLALPDGVDITIPLSSKFELVPYISWGGVEFNLDGKENMRVSWGAGLRLIYRVSEFYVGPYGGIKGFYETGEKGWVAGLNLGWKF